MVSRERPELCDLGRGHPPSGPRFPLIYSEQPGLVSSTGAPLLSGLKSFEVQEGCSSLRPRQLLGWWGLGEGPLRTRHCLMRRGQASGESGGRDLSPCCFGFSSSSCDCSLLFYLESFLEIIFQKLIK